MAIDEILALVNSDTSETLDVKIEEAKNDIMQASITGIGKTVFEYNTVLSLKANNQCIFAKFVAPCDGIYKATLKVDGYEAGLLYLYKVVNRPPTSTIEGAIVSKFYSQNAVGEYIPVGKGFSRLTDDVSLSAAEVKTISFLFNCYKGEAVILTADKDNRYGPMINSTTITVQMN